MSVICDFCLYVAVCYWSDDCDHNCIAALATAAVILPQVTNGDGLSPVDLMSESSSVKMKEILTSLRFNMDLFRIILQEDVTCAEV